MNQETPKILADLFDTFFRSDEHAKKVNIVLDISTIYVISLLVPLLLQILILYLFSHNSFLYT